MSSSFLSFVGDVGMSFVCLLCLFVVVAVSFCIKVNHDVFVFLSSLSFHCCKLKTLVLYLSFSRV